MTISRKLYTAFGSILGIVIVLSLVSYTASHIENSARSTAAEALTSTQTIEGVRFQVMQQGLDLRNFLLSGDPRMEAAEASDGESLHANLRAARATTQDEQLRTMYDSIGSIQQSWEDEFARPLIAKRHDVDAGKTTVSHLQIVYLEHSTNNWVERIVAAMDESEREIKKGLEKSEASVNLAAMISNVVLSLGTIVGAL